MIIIETRVISLSDQVVSDDTVLSNLEKIISAY